MWRLVHAGDTLSSGRYRTTSSSAGLRSQRLMGFKVILGAIFQFLLVPVAIGGDITRQLLYRRSRRSYRECTWTMSRATPPYRYALSFIPTPGVDGFSLFPLPTLGRRAGGATFAFSAPANRLKMIDINAVMAAYCANPSIGDRLGRSASRAAVIIFHGARRPMAS